jgi:hypothetical protein
MYFQHNTKDEHITTPSLTDFVPTEIIEYILSFTSIDPIFCNKLCLVSKSLREIAYSDNMWRNYFYNLYPHSSRWINQNFRNSYFQLQNYFHEHIEFTKVKLVSTLMRTTYRFRCCLELQQQGNHVSQLDLFNKFS